MYMPKYNELKHFNANKIVQNYHSAIQEQKRQAEEAARRGPLNLQFTI
jgi:hypothetical protein